MAAAQSYNSKLKQKAITLLLHILQVILQGFCGSCGGSAVDNSSFDATTGHEEEVLIM